MESGIRCKTLAFVTHCHWQVYYALLACHLSHFIYLLHFCLECTLPFVLCGINQVAVRFLKYLHILIVKSDLHMFFWQDKRRSLNCSKILYTIYLFEQAPTPSITKLLAYTNGWSWWFLYQKCIDLWWIILIFAIILWWFWGQILRPWLCTSFKFCSR